MIFGCVNNEISVDLPLPKKPSLLSNTLVSAQVTQREHKYNVSLSLSPNYYYKKNQHYILVQQLYVIHLQNNGMIIPVNHIQMLDHK